MASKDDLVITREIYSVTSAGQGLSGKDSVRIADGSITVNSQKDGIHSENTTVFTQTRLQKFQEVL